MIKIIGGPRTDNIKIIYINDDDGSEVELKNITSIKINELLPGSKVTVSLETLVSLDINAALQALKESLCK